MLKLLGQEFFFKYDEYWKLLGFVLGSLDMPAAKLGDTDSTRGY